MTGSMSMIVIPAEIRDYIATSNFIGGELTAQASTYDEDLFVVTRIERSPGAFIRPRLPHTFRALSKVASGEVQGQWLTKVPSGTNVLHYDLQHRPGSGYPFADFSAAVPNVRDPRGRSLLLVTHEPDMPQEWIAADVPEYAGWHVTNECAMPVNLAIEPAQYGLELLDPQWPVNSLLTKRVGVVGVGSIGGVVADALAAYGVGTLDLIDPDRFLWHNQVRHLLGPEAVGFKKVDAMTRYLKDRWPTTEVNPHPVDVVAKAHEMRALFPQLDAVVCAADGIAPRRVVSHLARRTHLPAVLACVLEDGAVGEVLRLRPGPKYGCLLCQRAALAAKGGIDVEALQERDYGTGNPHLPMTAVGPDLWLVGHLAAKAVVGTVLEAQHGDLSHRLPGDHAVIGLRPSADVAHAPFDVSYAEQVQWSEVPEPRPDCPTCSTP